MPSVAVVSDYRDAAGRCVIESVATNNPAREIFALCRARLADQHVENIGVLIVIGGHLRRGEGVLADGCHIIRPKPSLGKLRL